MRKEILKLLREKFTDAMAVALPKFSAMKSKSAFFSARELLFRYVVGSVHLFVILVPKDSDEASFTVELAWSRLGRLPELGMRPSRTPSSPRIEQQDVEGAVRLREVVGEKDEWWEVMPLDATDPASVIRFMEFQMKPIDQSKIAELLDPLVEDAVAMIVKHGVPYMDEILAWR